MRKLSDNERFNRVKSKKIPHFWNLFYITQFKNKKKFKNHETKYYI